MNISSLFPTPYKLTFEEILLSSASTLIFNSLEAANRSTILISQICEPPQYGFTASAETIASGPRFVRITDIKGGTIDWRSVPFCACDNPDSYRLRSGDILVARAGSIGKSVLVKDVPELSVFASYMIRLRSKNINCYLPAFIYWFFQSRQYWNQIAKFDRGSAMSNINSKMLFAIRLPEASLDEQKQIVDFLDVFRKKLFGQETTLFDLQPPMDNVRRIVERIEAVARRVEEAQKLREEVFDEANIFITRYHLSLADGCMVRANEVLDLDEDKVSVELTEVYPQVGVRGFGKGLFARETLGGDQTTYKWFNRLYPGAIVLSQVKGWEGAIAVCEAELAGRYVSPEYRTFRCKQNLAHPEYLSYIFSTPWFYAQLSGLSRGVGGRRERVRPELFLEMEIPMPTYEKQVKSIPIFQRMFELKRLELLANSEQEKLLTSLLAQIFTD